MQDDARAELQATLAARRELGPEHDEHLIAGFLARIESEIDRRVDERVAKRSRGRGSHHAVLQPATLGVCIPIVAIAGGIGGVAGLIAAFAALVIVFAIASYR